MVGLARDLTFERHRPLIQVGWLLRATVLIVVILAFAALGSQPRSLRSRLADVSARQSFSLVAWEAEALLGSLRRRLNPPAVPADEAARVAHARDYFALVAEIADARGQLAAEFNRPADVRDAAALVRAELHVRDLEARAEELRPSVEEVISRQVGQSLYELGLRPGLVAFDWPGGAAGPSISLYPPVYFQFESLPLSLFVAPRDRVAIVGSVLLESDLDAATIESLEKRVDRRNVSSIVSRIGGIATYPSMIPDGDSLGRDLTVIAHEWMHHYLVFRPLGRAYFSSYPMRSINELVADMVGAEVGAHAYGRFYAKSEPATVGTPARAAAGEKRPDFGAEMRRIRQRVEELLAAGQVEEAERYMREQRDALNEMGFAVRRLNTAYLAFFGAYSGTANPYEAPLRRIRERSRDLAEFVRVVEAIDSPERLFELAS